VAAVLAGVGLALSLPPFGFWPLAFLGAGLLYLLLDGRTASRRLALGWLAGLGCFVPGLWWAGVFNWYGAALLMAVEAGSMAVAALLVPRWRCRLPAFVGAFTVLEAARLHWPFGGLPLGGVFLGQADGPFLALARLGGPLVVTAAVWLTGAGIAEAIRALTRKGGWGARRRHLMPAACALWLTVALVPLAGAAPDGGPAQRDLVVAAVQGGGERGTSALQVPPSTVFAAQRAATGALLAKRGDEGSPTLVVWPEDVVALGRPLAGSAQEAVLGRLARRLRATLVVGVTVTVSPTSFRNEVVAFAPSGRLVGTFEKVHRVPFGEYVPFRSFVSHLANLQAVPRDAVAGHGSGLLRTPAARLGILVSFEVFFASRSASSVAAGAQVLVVPTNTSSYATSQVPGQELAAGRLQAVETGRDLVQASPTGYSDLVDHRGVVSARTVLGHRQVLTGVVGLRGGTTLYDRFGDPPVLALAALALAASWAAGRRRVSASATRRRASP
jgi:apolipoprotein N-acyltransferase